MSDEENLHLAVAFSDNREIVEKRYTDLGWKVHGYMNLPNLQRPERGDIIHISLVWPYELGNPIYPT